MRPVHADVRRHRAGRPVTTAGPDQRERSTDPVRARSLGPCVAPALGDGFVCQPGKGTIAVSANNTAPVSAGDDVRPHSLAAHPSDPAVTCWCGLDTETGPAGPILVLRVAGEIDMLTVPLVRTALRTAQEQAPGDLVVDLAGVTFCCVRGFALLADAAHAALAAGTRLAVSGLNDHLDRITTILWLDEPMVRYRSVAAAVTAIRIDHTYLLA